MKTKDTTMTIYIDDMLKKKASKCFNEQYDFKGIYSLSY